MTVAVVTDSAAALPEAVAETLGIRVIPLRLALGDKTLRDGDLDIGSLIARPGEVSTSGPTPGDFLAAIEDCSPEGAVILTVSHDIAAGSYVAARAAARAAECPVRVVDTETAAGGQGLVVLAAAERAAAGASVEATAATGKRVAQRVRLVATLPNLDQLAKSGHVPGAAAWATRFVGLSPVFEFRRGRVRPLLPAASTAGARQRLLALLRSSRPASPGRLHVAFLHALAPDDAAELEVAVAAEYEPATSFVGPFDTAMIVHTGPGVLGLAWWWEEP